MHVNDSRARCRAARARLASLRDDNVIAGLRDDDWLLLACVQWKR